MSAASYDRDTGRVQSAKRPRAAWAHALLAALAASAVGASAPAQAANDGPEPEAKSAAPGIGADIKAYVTAPLHAGRKQWIAFGGSDDTTWLARVKADFGMDVKLPE